MRRVEIRALSCNFNDTVAKLDTKHDTLIFFSLPGNVMCLSPIAFFERSSSLPLGSASGAPSARKRAFQGAGREPTAATTATKTSKEKERKSPRPQPQGSRPLLWP